MEPSSASTCLGGHAAGIVLIVVMVAALLLPFSILFFRHGNNRWVRCRNDRKKGIVSLHDEQRQGQEVGNQRQNATSSIKKSNESSSRQLSGEAITIMRRDSFKRVETEATSPAAVDAMKTGKKQINNSWRCACEGGFLPPGMFGNMEAVLKMGSGQCYHKQ